MEAIKKELEDYLEELRTFSSDMAQDGDAMRGYLIRIANIMARANFIIAEFEMRLRKKKQNIYLEKMIEGEMKLSPSLAKDFIDSLCDEEGYVYRLAERLSRTCVHTIEAVRTIISDLKSERQYSGF